MVDRRPATRRRNDGIGAFQHHHRPNAGGRGPRGGELVITYGAKKLGEFAAMRGDDGDAAQLVGLARESAERIGIRDDLPLGRDELR